MKNFKTCYYQVQTDLELLTSLLSHFENQGINTIMALKGYLLSLHLDDFTQLYQQLTAEDPKLGDLLFDLSDRIRQAPCRRPELFESSSEFGIYLQDKLLGKKQEQFWCLYLDSQNRIVYEKLISQGTADATLVHPREVFRWAVLSNISGIIVAHNHPSGTLIPSTHDRRTTEKLQNAATMMQIDLLDHFIVAQSGYFSMREHELI